ncbi:MAG: hypothetical protein LBV79_06295 [Candidatus Adiutrix sp.]|jgi:hypothetical protein|nr:hypothetical protein [Candidatus Adiutrix sp.]
MAQYTPFLGVTKVEPGQQQAHVVVNEAFDNYDKAVAGLAEIDLTGKPYYEMPARESTNAMLRFTGADQSCVVIIQQRPKMWTVLNDSEWLLRFSCSWERDEMELPAGETAVMVCDGVKIRRVSA